MTKPTYNKFKNLVDAWSASQDGMYKLLTVNENDQELVEVVQHNMNLQDTVFLQAMAKLFGEDFYNEEFKQLIISDGWFWAEWNSTEECYGYVCGKVDGWRYSKGLL